MQKTGIFGSKRMISGIMGFLILAVVLFSAFFLAVEADHDCEGEDCPICSVMHLCEENLHRLGSAAFSPVLIVLPALAFFIISLFSAFDITQETLVSKKIRLNN